MCSESEVVKAEIERVCTSLEQGSWKRENRAGGRHPFPAFVHIARCGEDGPPKRANFICVPCYDLSRGGFSFYAKTRPDYQYLVVRLGDLPEANHILARIAHCTPHDGAEKAYRVGCEFLRKLILPP